MIMISISSETICILAAVLSTLSFVAVDALRAAEETGAGPPMNRNAYRQPPPKEA